MTVSYFSNFLNHHQVPFCEAMKSRLGDGFTFIATERIPEERLAMGYRDLEDTDYVLRSYDSDLAYAEAVRLGAESDLVIIGDAPDTFIRQRLQDDKLTFRYSERYFKKVRWRFDPRAWKLYYDRDFRYRNKPLYMLCAGAYTASDCRFILSYPGKTYRWGYFPAAKQYEDIDALIAMKRPASILWAGRLIGLKHPERVIDVAQRLKKEGYSFSAEIIGDGEMRPKLQKMIYDRGLDDCVRLLGSMPPEKVREHMEQADIYLFTSDRSEGWGAVLNEAMNSACAVVANRSIGSVPYLIRDGVNGLAYHGGRNELYKKVRHLLDDERMRTLLQRNACMTITELWNAETAAQRLLHLAECIREGRDVPYETGPCSRD